MDFYGICLFEMHSLTDLGNGKNILPIFDNLWGIQGISKILPNFLYGEIITLSILYLSMTHFLNSRLNFGYFNVYYKSFWFFMAVYIFFIIQYRSEIDLKT